MSGEVVTEYGGRQLVSRDLDMMFCLKSHWGAAGKVLYRDLQSHVKVGTANPSEGAQPAPGAFVLDGKPNSPGMAHDLAANLGTHRCMSLSDRARLKNTSPPCRASAGERARAAERERASERERARERERDREERERARARCLCLMQMRSFGLYTFLVWSVYAYVGYVGASVAIFTGMQMS